MAEEKKFDLYQEITDRIIAELESGTVPWHKPWITTGMGISVVADPRRMAVSHATGRAYSIMNQMMLKKPGEYVTFDECRKEGGKVKKGSKSKLVVFWKVVYVDEKDPITGAVVTDGKGNPKKKPVPLLRYSRVFHLDDTEGLTPKVDVTKLAQPKRTSAGAVAIPEADAVIDGYVARSGVGFEARMSDRAYYAPYADRVVVPCIDQYKETAEYYSTTFHELVHSTGHHTRLKRFGEDVSEAAAFGSESYSKEELVAEIGSVACVNTLGIETEGSFHNSAAYIENWLQVLKKDKRMIVSAASRAQNAVEMIFGIGGEDDA